ncbi:hypothetical protein FI667_g5136, partial [Globisporangium splendens]
MCMALHHAASAPSSTALPATAMDPFDSFFQALRGSLEAQVAASTAVEFSSEQPVPLNRWPSEASTRFKNRDEDAIQERCGSAADTFVSVLAAQHPSMKASLLQSAKSYSSSRIQELRRRRRHMRRQRAMRIDQLQQQKRAVEHECKHAVLKVTATQYYQFVSHSNAFCMDIVVWQTLFFECIAEMKKALNRIDGVSFDEATTEDASESLMLHDQRARQFAWDLFLLRLREDVNDSLCFTQLYPAQMSRAATTGKSDASGGSDATEPLKTSMQLVLLRNGPTLDVGHTLQVQQIVAIGPRTKSSAASEQDRSKGKPSLHFGDSGVSSWMSIVRHSRLPTQPAPLSSARRVRQLKSTAASFAIRDAKGYSEFRQLGSISTTAQFPRTECDVPLSSSYIRWLLQERENSPGLSNETVVDSNVYFDLDEFKANFANVVTTQRSKGAGTDDSSWTAGLPSALVTDSAMLASTQRSLQEIESTIAKIGGARGGTLPASLPTHQLMIARPATSNNSSTSSSDETPSPKQGENKKETIFMRASVLQLLQTAHYATAFLTQLSPSDVVFLEQLCGNFRRFEGLLLRSCLLEIMLTNLTVYFLCLLRYPTSLFGAGILSTLYVPYLDAEVNMTPPQSSDGIPKARDAATMRPLDPSCIHELLLVYVARARSSSNERDSSGPSDRGASQQQLSSLAASDAISSLLPHHLEQQEQQMVYQCVIKNPGALWKRSSSSFASNMRQEDDDKASFQQILAAADSVLSNIESSHRIQNHAREAQQTVDERAKLPQFLRETQIVPEEDAQQYVLSGDEVTTCISALAHCSSANTTKRLVLHASSLLDVQTTPQRKPKDTDQELEAVLTDLQASLEEMKQIESVEYSATQELQRLTRLATYPGVDISVIRNAVEEVKALDADIRTKDLQLLFQLSTRKLQLLQRRQEALEARLSAPSMTSDREQDTSSLVYDVVHMLRKGKKSLLQQQQNQQRSRHLPPPRPQSASSLGESDTKYASGLTRSVSDILNYKSRASYQSQMKQQPVRPTGNGLGSKQHRIEDGHDEIGTRKWFGKQGCMQRRLSKNTKELKELEQP